MDVQKAIETRRSIRKFKKTPIKDDIIFKILEAANLAPTAGNNQPWEFMILDRSILEKISKITNQSFEDRLQQINRSDFNEKLKNLPIPKTRKEDKVEALNRFYKTLGGAPLAILVYVEKEKDPWQWKNNICDASAAIENLLLAAWNEGLGSCWMTGPLKTKDKQIKSYLGIPQSKEIVGIIPIGIPAHNPRMPPKVNVRSKIIWFNI